MSYNLIHFVVGDAHLEPLVQSQVFEQAELQMTYQGGLKPQNVKVLYYCHYRDFLNGNNARFLRDYRKKFSAIQIIPIYRGVRFSKYIKAIQFLFYIYSRYPLIIHCRGESAHREIRTLPFLKYFKKRTVLDVRGIWPYEQLLLNGIKDFSNIAPQERIIFRRNMLALLKEVNTADGISFVSKNLQNLIAEQTNTWTGRTIIVPCVASSRMNYQMNSHVEKQKNAEYFTIVYVGTDKSYQHLEDLVFPFVKRLMLFDSRVRLKILSKDKESILLKLNKIAINMDKVTLKSVDRNDVFNEIVDSDLALLLREPNVVNKVSSPVKLGEYLACGLPILFQKDSIGFSGEILDNRLGLEIDLMQLSKWDNEVFNVIEFLENEKLENSKNRIQKFFREKYCWESFVQNQRGFYRQILDN
jgi:hypothetical protein